MKQTKRITALLLLPVLAVLLLAGCGQGGSAPSPAPTAAPTAAATAQPTAAPTPQATAAPTPEPTAAPTTEPSAEPTPDPTPEPTPEPTPAPTPEPTPAPTPEPTPAPTPEPTEEPSSLVEPGMEPVTAESLAEGSYPVAVDCSSASFRIEDCILTVSGGKMEAVLTLGGTGYPCLRMGSAEDAAAAGPEDPALIPYAEDGQGRYTYALPVEALNAPIPIAAYNGSKEKWYDRTLLFRADSLPPAAFTGGGAGASEGPELADGTYTVEIVFSGGSGRASVESPALLTVENGIATVRIVWSSSNYDYMKLDGTQYFPVNEEGNSTFLIPVPWFDRPVTVIGDTTAMSTPHEIEYTLTFLFDSLREAE